MTRAVADFRARVLASIVSALQADSRALACWEGGSAATGRRDEFSDIDLCVLAQAQDNDHLFALIEGRLPAIAPIEHAWQVEPAPFPGLAQRIYLLADAPPYFALDCALLTVAGVEPFLARERHGEPVVYFDRTGGISARPLDRGAHGSRIAQRRAQIGQAVPIFAMLVRKELARGRPLEAMGFYQVLIRHLVELLGIRYRPERFDFGLRYVHSDLPEAAQQRLGSLLFIADGAALNKKLDQLQSALAEELAGAVPAPEAEWAHRG